MGVIVVSDVSSLLRRERISLRAVWFNVYFPIGDSACLSA